MMLELNAEITDQLVFNTREIRKAWWVPLNELHMRYEEYLSQNIPFESWTEIMITEYFDFVR